MQKIEDQHTVVSLFFFLLSRMNQSVGRGAFHDSGFLKQKPSAVRDDA
jgi:hypothetical protein